MHKDHALQTLIIIIHFLSSSQVDAMKIGLKEMKKEYKKVNLDEIEVSTGYHGQAQRRN